MVELSSFDMQGYAMNKNVTFHFRDLLGPASLDAVTIINKLKTVFVLVSIMQVFLDVRRPEYVVETDESIFLDHSCSLPVYLPK